MNLAKQPLTRATRWISTKTWTCPECRIQGQVKRSRIADDIKHRTVWQRPFSSTIRRREEDTKKPISPNTTASPSETITPASTSTSLPSHTANQRSQTSIRLSAVIDQLLARASLASQHINAYTGTDYSGIEALRLQIIDQERKVKEYHKTVESSKTIHHNAQTKQTSAQREIVGLLERKSSWSPTDLERYMSLVRSEHLIERDVQVAKDELAEAERNLEDARSLLERLERKQYHEEQIWSDTIRRNSTWVTFGLMGVNILLLLAQIAIFEPYRRKKIVREVTKALDEKMVTVASPEVEREVDVNVPPSDVSLEQIEAGTKQPLDGLVPEEKETQKTPLDADFMMPPEASDFAGAIPVSWTTEVSSARPYPGPDSKSKPKSTLETYQDAFLDLFSDRLVQLRKVDVTNTALQGAASGIAVMGLLFVLLRPR